MRFYETHFSGNIGIIDLGDLSVQVVSLGESTISEHIGGAAVNRVLFDRYGSDDPIILGTGPLTGSFAPASSLMIATFRSPLSGKISNVPLTIRTGPEMKCAGFDFLVMKNAASLPQIVSVHAGTIAFRAAGLLLNRGITEISSIARRHFRHARSSIITGPAADKRAVSASVSVSRGGSFDKTGLASMMASKNVKAVIFDGVDGLPFGDGNVARAETMLEELAQSLRGKNPGFIRILEQFGAGSAVMELLPTKKMRPMACYHCPFPCMSHIEVTNEDLSAHKDAKGERRLLLTDHLGFMALADKCKTDVFSVMAACNEGGLDPIAVSRLIAGNEQLDDVLSTIKSLCGGMGIVERNIDGKGDRSVFSSIPNDETDRFGGGIAPFTAGGFDTLEPWKKRVALSMILGICPLFLLMFSEIRDSDLLDFIASEGQQERGRLHDRLDKAIDTVCRP